MSRRHLVLAIALTIGVYDVAVGLFMLLAPSPHLAHGTQSLWATAPALGDVAQPFVHSALARLGAFSFHAGLVTIVWCALGWRDRRVMTALLLTYLVSGAAFFATDLRYFAGTPYFAIKQALGALWAAAALLHFTARAEPRRTPQTH